MVKKKVPVLSIVLYVLAGILVAFSVWSVIYDHSYIVAQGVTFKGNEYNIVNYYMSSAGLFTILAVILSTLGWILQKFSPLVETAAVETFAQEEYVPDGVFAEEIQEEEAGQPSESIADNEGSEQ